MTRPLLVALRPLGLGDHLTGLPALRALADAFPDHRRVLATSAAMVPLARHTGAVDAVTPAQPLAPLDPALTRPDVAVDLHGRGPASQRVLLALAPRRLVSFACPEVPETAGGAPWWPEEHEVARWCRMLDHAGIPADPTRLDVDPPVVAVPPAARGAVLVHVGAAAPGRRWPPERFAAVARALVAAGDRVVVTGGPLEVAAATAVAEGAGLPADHVLTALDLLSLVATVAAAAAVVVGDTGVAHVATAVGTPSVVLFGPIPPAEWGPPADRPWHRALWAGRRGDPHGVDLDPGLLALTPQQVLAALDGVRRAAAAPVGGVPAP
ncbi:MAG TPA: glycosyltransferase family 9 protein [Acidimicrobiales bacterium]|nr:glycosyltransferase family 9 protein [Acidimicrobiales bacterium]